MEDEHVCRKAVLDVDTSSLVEEAFRDCCVSVVLVVAPKAAAALLRRARRLVVERGGRVADCRAVMSSALQREDVSWTTPESAGIDNEVETRNSFAQPKV